MSEGVLTKGRCAIAFCSYLKSIINMWFRKDIKFKYYFFILISNWNYKCSPRSSPAMLCMHIQSQTWSYLLHIFVDKMHSYSLLFSMNFSHSTLLCTKHPHKHVHPNSLRCPETTFPRLLPVLSILLFQTHVFAPLHGFTVVGSIISRRVIERICL